MFRGQNPFDDVVANATSETLTSENWDLILTICEKVDRSGSNAGRDCVAAIQKRITSNKNTNVILYSLSLCESLSKNCGIKVQRELASRAFTQLLVKILNEKTTHPAVRQRILELIQQWAFEFRNDPSLGLMDETFQQLRSQSKFKFPSPQKPKKELKSEADKRKEEEELQLALALSLSASEHKSQLERQASIKAQQKVVEAAAAASAPKKRVRALYDFEPSESGELGFQKGDVIQVLATTYQDWWKGELYGREGLFPINYVEEIKDIDPTEEAEAEAHVVQETRNLDSLIHMLSNVDPRDNFSENETLQNLYNNALGVRPKVVEFIKKYGEKKDELASLGEKLAKARATYERMMEQSIAKYSNAGYQVGGGYQPYDAPPQQQPPPQQPPYLGNIYGQPPPFQTPQNAFVNGPAPYGQQPDPHQQQQPQPYQPNQYMTPQMPQQTLPQPQPPQPLPQGSAPLDSQYGPSQPQFQGVPPQSAVPPQQQQQQQLPVPPTPQPISQPLPHGQMPPQPFQQQLPPQPFDQQAYSAPVQPMGSQPPLQQDFSAPVSMQGPYPPSSQAPMQMPPGPPAGYPQPVQAQQQLAPQPQGQMYAY